MKFLGNVDTGTIKQMTGFWFDPDRSLNPGIVLVVSLCCGMHFLSVLFLVKSQMACLCCKFKNKNMTTKTLV